MQITSLSISNFKTIKAIKLQLDENGKLVILSGANGAGKSSVLDAIWAAIAGRKAAKETTMPIRDGQTRAEVVIEFGPYKVTRTWTKKDTYLYVEGKDGLEQLKPQELLDKFYSDIALDPLAFSRMSAKEQRAELLRVAKVDMAMVEQLSIQEKRAYDHRTHLNSEIDTLEGQLAGIEMPKVIPAGEVSVTELAQKLTNMERARTEALADEKEYRANAIELERLQARQAELAAKWKGGAPKAEDIVLLQGHLALAESDNRNFRIAQQHKGLSNTLHDKYVRVDETTRQIEELRKERIKILTDAPMPIPGLTTTEEGVFFEGIPFSQLSTAMKLKVSLSIAMAQNPDLRVIRIYDGSLFDSTNLKVVEQMAVAKDFQVWMEVVDESGKRGIVIEEGEVKSINASA